MSVPAIFYAHRCESPVKSISQVGSFYHMNNVEVPHRRDRRKKLPGADRGDRHQSLAKIAGDQIRRDRRIKSPGVSLALVREEKGIGRESVLFWNQGI